MLEIRDADSFKRFLDEHPERSRAYTGLRIGRPFDVSHADFDALVTVVLSFGVYEAFHLRLHPTTHELFLANRNVGGHGARCRVLKVPRADLSDRPRRMMAWYKDHARAMWR